MATLQVGQATIGYAVEGTGTPLLLFHGTTMDRTAWDMVRAAMPADSYAFVLAELPGSGESSMPTEPLTVEGIVAQALALMSHLGHETFDVAGYSLGAVVALATAGTAPDRVRSVTSLCGWAAGDARMRVTFDLWKRLISTDRELFVRYAFADGFTVGALTVAESMVDALVPMSAGLLAPGSLAHLDLDIALDISALLPAITARALVIGGVEDRWVDIAHSRAIAAAIDGATLVELPAGHMAIQELAVEIAELVHHHVSG
jgi:pimeloyl-ACP methyl ester carboxylesterase